MLRTFLGRGLVMAVVCAVLAPSAAASDGLTAGLGTPNLVSRVAITVPVNVSCSPFDPSLTLVAESVTVTVQQASANRIASGSVSVFSFYPSTLFACDGSTQTVPVTVFANVAGPPFHGGPAVFSATVSAAAGVSCGGGCFIETATQTGHFGPTAINMH